ncbi:TonB-dependent receptor [Flavobacterium piscisymbiosum]|uniref:TonB-dependent receptor n=1 Tax=Flavobacterium piscisymbiosum TaxID=2893753 RepID=A0ABS8MC60_9FLAO|nr:TonB-dependent receptor [Flavobacterium sp. F-30]MCC9063008.1 TonB-dependent receptor [Flavobacterium sp. F-30]
MQISKIFSLALILLTSIQGFSQSKKVILNGIILENTGKPAEGVSVALKGTAYSTLTNENGEYEIAAEPGNYVLSVSSVGFKSKQTKINLQSDQTVPSISIEEDMAALNEVQVKGISKVTKIKESAFQVNAVDTKAMANITSNLSQVLNKTTGVKVREQGGMGSDFEFSINGLSGSAIKFFIDGIPLDIMGSSMTLNNIPVNLSERIEVYKGVVPVNLGSDALGGAVNIITNHQISDYLDMSYSFGSFNTHSTSLTGQARDKKSGLIFKASGFLNYSDNDYKMRGVEVREVIDADNGRFVKGDFRRFNDQFKSVMGQAELGFVDKSWADVFFIGGSYSATEKGIQTGTNQNVVYGQVHRGGDAYSFSLRYLKKNLFTKDLDFSLFSSYSDDQNTVTDLAYRKYYWDGKYVPNQFSETGKQATKWNIQRPKYFIASNLSYKINDNNSLSLNYTLDKVDNKTYDKLINDKDDNPGKLTKNIVGLSYQQNFFEEKLTNTFFGKYYGMILEQPFAITDSGTGAGGTIKDNNGYTGYGIASRYKITPSIGIKASYEKAYRLQRVDEMFGNGYSVVANPDLKPENSNNYNVGGYWKNEAENHHFFVETGGYLRKAKDFISAIVYQSNTQISKFQNTSNIIVKGLEADIKYNYQNKINAGINFTYQKTLDDTKYPNGSNSGTISATYRDDLPNTPWMFGNANLGYRKSDFIKKGNNLQFNWDLQYTHWYYLTWAKYGVDNSKIPDQYIQNVSVSYSMNEGRYNVSLECNNLTNYLAYDNFKLQKQGRSFSIKFHYFLK